MKRREFAGQLLALGAVSGLALSGQAQAQGTPVEGTNYRRLDKPQPVLVPNKIEVIEFMWYGCPHCFALEPTLEPWKKALPADVAFRRVPVAFRDEPFVAHQKILYALEALGQLEAMHSKVFAAIHVDHMRLDKPDEISAFMAKNGLDATKFMGAYNSFSVATHCKQATQLSLTYGIEGVPSMGVAGKYLTSGDLAGTNDGMLSVVDFLIKKERKAA